MKNRMAYVDYSFLLRFYYHNKVYVGTFVIVYFYLDCSMAANKNVTNSTQIWNFFFHNLLFCLLHNCLSISMGGQEVRRVQQLIQLIGLCTLPSRTPALQNLEAKSSSCHKASIIFVIITGYYTSWNEHVYKCLTKHNNEPKKTTGDQLLFECFYIFI